MTKIKNELQISAPIKIILGCFLGGELGILFHTKSSIFQGFFFGSTERASCTEDELKGALAIHNIDSKPSAINIKKPSVLYAEINSDGPPPSYGHNA